MIWTIWIILQTCLPVVPILALPFGISIYLFIICPVGPFICIIWLGLFYLMVPTSCILQIFPPNEKIENINDQYWTLRAEEASPFSIFLPVIRLVDSILVCFILSWMWLHVTASLIFHQTHSNRIIRYRYSFELRHWAWMCKPIHECYLCIYLVQVTGWKWLGVAFGLFSFEVNRKPNFRNLWKLNRTELPWFGSILYTF